MKIKEKIKEEIVNRDTITEGLKKLKLLSQSEQDVLQAISLLSNYEHQNNANLLFPQDSITVYARVSNLAISLANQLPEDDYEVFSIYLSRLLKQDLSRAWTLFCRCRSDSDYLQSEVEQFEDFDEGAKWILERERLFSSRLSHNWIEGFWEDLSYDTSLTSLVSLPDSSKSGDYLAHILELQKKHEE